MGGGMGGGDGFEEVELLGEPAEHLWMTHMIPGTLLLTHLIVSLGYLDIPEYEFQPG